MAGVGGTGFTQSFGGCAGQEAQGLEIHILIAAMHPCPYGYFGDPVKECTCSLSMVSRYQKCISGPLLDRIDVPTKLAYIEVPRVEYEKLADDRLGEKSEDIRARVEKAREVRCILR